MDASQLYPVPGKPTSYLGILYRSRAEAKWAVVMTMLGMPFYYEPSHYQLPSGSYLPDFWLPQLSSYLEVKPRDLFDPRHGELGELKGKRIYLVSTSLPTIPYSQLEEDVYPALAGHIWQKWPDLEPDYMLAREAQGRINIVPIRRGGKPKGNDLAILNAYDYASHYHFEESPCLP